MIAAGLRNRTAKIVCPGYSIAVGLISRSLLRKKLFPDLLESVIPECFYRWFDWLLTTGEIGAGPPIRTFGVTLFAINSRPLCSNTRHIAVG